jgi:hypothetical protein
MGNFKNHQDWKDFVLRPTQARVNYAKFVSTGVGSEISCPNGLRRAAILGYDAGIKFSLALSLGAGQAEKTCQFRQST